MPKDAGELPEADMELIGLYADCAARHEAILLLVFAAILLGLALALSGCMPGVVTVDTGG